MQADKGAVHGQIVAGDRVLVDGGIVVRAQAKEDDLTAAPRQLDGLANLIADRVDDDVRAQSRVRA